MASSSHHPSSSPGSRKAIVSRYSGHPFEELLAWTYSLEMFIEKTHDHKDSKCGNQKLSLTMYDELFEKNWYKHLPISMELTGHTLKKNE